ncbi:ATP-binding protein, partial [Planomonospora parontospora]
VKYTPGGGTVTVTAGHDTGTSTGTGTGHDTGTSTGTGTGAGEDGQDGQDGQERAAAVVVTVADTGIGIPAEQYDQLFTRFFRASTARAAGIKGTGLGLAITRAIVEAHAGAITAAPREGGGTVFTVRLPADPLAPQ